MIKFDESTHTYTYNGKVLPSVSTILGATIFKDKYKDVDPYILQRAAQFGTGVHKAIEIDDYFGLDDVQYTVFKRYKRLCKKHDIKPIAYVHIQLKYKINYEVNFDRNSNDGNIITYISIRDPLDESKRVGNVVGSITYDEDEFDVDATRQKLITDSVSYIVSGLNLNSTDKKEANVLIEKEMLEEYLNLPDYIRLLLYTLAKD